MSMEDGNTFTVGFDKALTKTVDGLRLEGEDREAVVVRAITLLKVAVDAKERGERLFIITAETRTEVAI